MVNLGDNDMRTAFHELLAQLTKDPDRHQGVGDRLTECEILKLEEENSIKLPQSYKAFLQEFGDGAYWLYGCQAMDSVRRPFWLKDHHRQTPELVPLDGNGSFPRDSLLCLMAEDSNGGSWCWLTSAPTANGEWPLAYYMPSEEMLYYKVGGFSDWLNILISRQSEVIRVLDEEDKLGLG
jgi:hypothetical protein